jgi:hypothetical protein
MSGLGCTPTFDLLLSVLLLLRDADVVTFAISPASVAQCRSVQVAAVRYIPSDQTCAYHRQPVFEVYA